MSSGALLAALAALLLQCRDAQGFAVCAPHAFGSRRAPGDGVCRAIERTRNRASLRGVELNMAGDAEKGGLFGGFFSNMFGGAEDSSPDKDRVVRAITAPGGWDFTLEIGSQIARQLGGSGELAKGDVMTVNIGVGVRLTLDEGYDPPQGSVFIDDSKIFQGEGFWSILEDTDEGVPTAFQANLKCPEGLTVSGDLVVPPGNVYVNFKIKDEPPQEDAPVRGLDGVSFYNGRLTVKESVKSSFILTPYNGILAEFKIVGQCSALPRAAR